MENWANVLVSFDKLKQDKLTTESFLKVAKSLIQVITNAIPANTDDNLSKTIRDSARSSADIITQEGFFKRSFNLKLLWEVEKVWKVELVWIHINSKTSARKVLLEMSGVSYVPDFARWVTATSWHHSIKYHLHCYSSRFGQSCSGKKSHVKLSFKFSKTKSPTELEKLTKTGMLMNFESLLSEYDTEIGMMGDYAFGAHFLLEQVRVHSFWTSP